MAKKKKEKKKLALLIFFHSQLFFGENFKLCACIGQTYENMMDEEKWKLCSGRFVEEALFSFGLTRRHEHSCHRFILDLADEDVRKQFTVNELTDICNQEAHPLPPISSQLLEYLNSFINLKTIEDLEKQVRKRLYNFDEEFDLDWAQSSIQNAIRLFHANFFPLTDQTEADIIQRVWSFVDTIFDNTNVDVRTGEMGSTASSERKNEQRVPNQRKNHGHKTDLLFKVSNGEIGCSEVAKKDSGDAGTKELKELGLKVPKMMKDQLWQLARNHPEKSRRLAVIGYVMMGLKLRVVVMENPSTYICKINRTPAYYFPSTIETFGSQLGNLLGLVSQVKELACQTLDILNEPLPIRSTSYNPVINTPVQMLPCPPSPKMPSKKSSSNLEQ
ncbi:hypothetical protein BDC45DRAFT_523056 [Circinella umbellata]|nr:hypothetical protein BDC45DRAFT_523056 [Circinella umbellata]